jgi:hypothetical protein
MASRNNHIILGIMNQIFNGKHIQPYLVNYQIKGSIEELKREYIVTSCTNYLGVGSVEQDGKYKLPRGVILNEH